MQKPLSLHIFSFLSVPSVSIFSTSCYLRCSVFSTAIISKVDILVLNVSCNLFNLFPNVGVYIVSSFSVSEQWWNLIWNLECSLYFLLCMSVKQMCSVLHHPATSLLLHALVIVISLQISFYILYAHISKYLFS